MDETAMEIGPVVQQYGTKLFPSSSHSPTVYILTTQHDLLGGCDRRIYGLGTEKRV